MSKSLIALAFIAAGAIAADSAEVAASAKFEAPDDVAERLVAAGLAKFVEDEKPVKAAKKTKVRLLIDSALGNCNDVVEVDVNEIKALERDGVADSNKDAVAYALTLEQNKA